MGTYTFVYKNEIQGGVHIAAEFDDTQDPFIEDVLAAFEQFLLGCTFQPATIEKYIKTAAVQDARTERARLCAEFKAKHGL
jgi:hypothetical protein